MSLKRTNQIITLSLIGSLASADEYYVVKHHESLSNILYRQNISPIYGKHGALRKVLELNPYLKSRSGDLILPGTRILLALGDQKTENFSSRAEQSRAEQSRAAPPSEYSTYKRTPSSVECPPLVKVEAPICVEQKQENKTLNQTPISSSSLNQGTEEQDYYYEVSPSLSWKKLNSKENNRYINSSINAMSQTSYGASFLYGMKATPDSSLYSRFELERVVFKDDNDIHLRRKTFYATDFSFGARFSRVDVSLGMSDELFLTSQSFTAIDINSALLPSLRLSYLAPLYRWGKINLFLGTEGRVYLPYSNANFDSKLGSGFRFEFGGNLKNQSYKIGYEIHNINASENSTQAKNIYWMYVWEKF